MEDRHHSVLFNRGLFQADTPLFPASSRAARYGDGVFETVRVTRGSLVWWELHKARLMAGAEALRLEVDIDLLEGDIGQLLRLNGVSQGGVRISVSRRGGERGYSPKSRLADTVVETFDMEPYHWREPLTVCLSSYRRPSGPVFPPGAKVAQGLTSTLAGVEAQESGFEDAILLSDKGCVSETTSGNIFWRKGERLYTPALECGIVNGVVRQQVMQQRADSVEVGSYPLDHLLSAEEVFKTNVVIGLRGIGSIVVGEERYDFHSITEGRQIFLENFSDLSPNQSAEIG